LGVGNGKADAVFYDAEAQQMADAMVMAEARHIARRKIEERACECKQGMFPRAVTDRRKFLLAASSSFADVVSAPALGQTAGEKRRQAHFISTCRTIRPRSRGARLPLMEAKAGGGRAPKPAIVARAP
jgi:hypothetical protein